MDKDQLNHEVTQWLEEQMKSNPNLIINRPDNVKEILMKFMLEGRRDKMAIVSDFDYTLTKMWSKPGVKALGGHNILSLSDIVTPEFTMKLQNLAQQFHHYETSLTHTKEEKSENLVRWYRQVHQVIIDENLTKDSLKRMAEQVKTHYREGLKEFITKTEEIGIPLLVCSAGVGDIIEALLHHDQLLTSNLNIASNKMIFSPSPPHHLTDFLEPYIHVYNKGDYDVTNLPLYPKFQTRNYYLLLGDSLGDITMADRLPHSQILKIGFLNDQVDTLLPHYDSAYDIILTNDTTMEFVNHLINLLVKY